AEQRRECQPRCGISGFGKGRFLRELTHTAGKPPAAYGPCRCTVPKLRVIFGPAALELLRRRFQPTRPVSQTRAHLAMFGEIERTEALADANAFRQGALQRRRQA